LFDAPDINGRYAIKDYQECEIFINSNFEEEK